MAKHHSKHKGEGVKLVGSSDELINIMVSDPGLQQWVKKEINDEGPKHKQVLNALLLQRVSKLQQIIEEKTGKHFAMQTGYDYLKVNDDEDKVLPIPIPVNIDADKDIKKVLKAISHAPEHEALPYTICLQVIEWAIKNLGKKVSAK